MKDVQREALMIETEMERRFTDMIGKNTMRRYMPKSLTEELVAHKEKIQEINLKKAIGEPTDEVMANPSPDFNPLAPPKAGFALVREAIMDRLGGEFDYISFKEDLKDITSELSLVKNEFQTHKLV